VPSKCAIGSFAHFRQPKAEARRPKWLILELVHTRTDSEHDCFDHIAISQMGLGKAALTRLSFGKFSGEGYNKVPVIDGVPFLACNLKRKRCLK
jgi:hypothetical protein